MCRRWSTRLCEHARRRVSATVVLPASRGISARAAYTHRLGTGKSSSKYAKQVLPVGDFSSTLCTSKYTSTVQWAAFTDASSSWGWTQYLMCTHMETLTLHGHCRGLCQQGYIHACFCYQMNMCIGTRGLRMHMLGPWKHRSYLYMEVV